MTSVDSRPSTPSLLVDHDDPNDSLISVPSLDEEEPSWSCSTPMNHRIPLRFDDAPPAPRPRKRLHSLTTAAFIEADLQAILLPTMLSHEAIYMPTMLPNEDAWTPSLAATARYMLRQRRMAAVLGTHDEDRVQLVYREESNENSDEPLASNDSKLSSLDVALPPRFICKRRKSFNALCA
jgi:hypothetical protein